MTPDRMPKLTLREPLQDVLLGVLTFGFIVQREDKAVLPVAATQHITFQQFHLRAIHRRIVCLASTRTNTVILSRFRTSC